MTPQTAISQLDAIAGPLLERLSETIAGILLDKLAETRTENTAAWLDVSSAATYLSTSEQAIRAAVKRGQLPGKRPNGRVLFTRDELDRYVTRGAA